jgi:hypothetical protein
MTTSEQIANEVQSLERQLEALMDQLDAALIRARADLVPAATQWINRSVNAAIEQHAGIIQALGIERLREFKQKVAVLIKSLPASVEKHTADKSVWPHRAGNGKQRSDEGYFPSVFRDLISELGGILVEFKLAGDTDGRYSNWKLVKGGYRYAINPMFESRTLPNVTQYQTSVAEYVRLSNVLDHRKVDLQKAQARELFDSA